MKTRKRKTLYLAGPMRGIPLFNFPAFMAAAKRLRHLGFKIWNPAERDIKEDGLHPATDTPRPMREYMEYDLAALCRCDAVVVLPGWERSKGAKLEVYVARKMGLAVYDERLNEIPDAPLSILAEADELISGARHRDYGPPSRDLGRTGALWTALLRDRLRPGQRLTGADVAWMMALLKASRAMQTPGLRDHYLDAAGYVACGWECVQDAVRDACGLPNAAPGLQPGRADVGG